MTARPDEVVAWIEVTDTPYGEGLSFSDAANQPRGRYVQESALQSANARHEATERALVKMTQDVDIQAEIIRVQESRLAAVLALADRLEVEGLRLDSVAENAYEIQASATLDRIATLIRRAAAGEGDANQGDSNGRPD